MPYALSPRERRERRRRIALALLTVALVFASWVIAAQRGVQAYLLAYAVTVGAGGVVLVAIGANARKRERGRHHGEPESLAYLGIPWGAMALVAAAEAVARSETNGAAAPILFPVLRALAGLWALAAMVQWMRADRRAAHD